MGSMTTAGKRGWAREALRLRLLVVPVAMVAALVSASPAPAVVNLPIPTIPIPETGSFLYLNSQPGDFIGQGLEGLYTGGDNTISIVEADAAHSDIRAAVLEQGGADGWGVEIAAPQGQALAVGSYIGAMRASFHDPAKPGFEVLGYGRGCNQISAKFDVLAVEYDGDGNVALLDVIFEQHCEGLAPALFGRFRYD